MNNNQLIVIVIAILVAACIIGGAVAFTFNKPTTEVNVTMDNNTTNVTANLTEDVKQDSDVNTKSYGTCCVCGKALTYEESVNELTQGKVCKNCHNKAFNSEEYGDYANQKLKEAYPEDYANKNF